MAGACLAFRVTSYLSLRPSKPFSKVRKFGNDAKRPRRAELRRGLVLSTKESRDIFSCSHNWG